MVFELIDQLGDLVPEEERSEVLAARRAIELLSDVSSGVDAQEVLTKLLSDESRV